MDKPSPVPWLAGLVLKKGAKALAITSSNPAVGTIIVQGNQTRVDLRQGPASLTR